MKKLKINTAAFIINIIGASFYLIALIIAFTAVNYMHLINYINVITMIIWLFSLAGAIVSIIALIASKKHNIKIVGSGAGLIGHTLYFLFGIYPAIFCIALCILGAVILVRDNHYDDQTSKTIMNNQEIIDVDVNEIEENQTEDK